MSVPQTGVEMDWDTFYSPQLDARAAWREAVSVVAAQVKTKFPACNGRVDAAIKLVLAGDVILLPEGGATVGSASEGESTYRVNGECQCRDFPKAPEGLCKHRLAYGLAKRAQPRFTAQLAAMDAPVPPPEPAETPQTTPIPPQFLVDIKGRQFVMYAGLLNLATAHGLLSLSAKFISVTPDLALAEATATFADGRSFTEAADSTPGNVGAMVRPHFARLSLTRAKGRALRDALNISMVCVEELEG